ncbi:unnamed protein product [Leptidea sinapis]|uniref:Uncharacterized protein n=1 Tax=Leptidea sinapis TaxID=189913 RepID=A0A5E4Q763_9NEOP|nr:unnamed protein product [Leptidea sinapis]
MKATVRVMNKYVLASRQCYLSVNLVIKYNRVGLFSCRAEFGSNIIIVIQLSSEESLFQSCTKDSDQLLVYELGETFGGYWAVLPDSITDDTDPEYDETTQTVSKDSSPQDVTENYDVIQFEVPIVNVSANRNNDSWNFIYDVIQKVSISTTETSTGIPAQDLGTLDLFLKGTISGFGLISNKA